jgi:hypothetical protein
MYDQQNKHKKENGLEMHFNLRCINKIWKSNMDNLLLSKLFFLEK